MAKQRLLNPITSGIYKQVWSSDFAEDRMHDGRKYRILNVINQRTRERLTILINCNLKSADVLDVLSNLFIQRGRPTHVRSDKVPEFVDKALSDCFTTFGAQTGHIMPGRSKKIGITRASTPNCKTSFSTQ